MKGWPCLCPALPHFWQLGSCFMTEDSAMQAPGKETPLSIQVLRAQYEGLRRQQRAQAHLVVLPKGGYMPAPAATRIVPVWINKERRHSLSLEEAEPGAEGQLEEADGGCLQAPESPWHAHLEVFRCVQTFQRETSLPVKHKDKLMGSEQRLPQEGDPGLLENNQRTQQGAKILQRAWRDCPVGNAQTKAVRSCLHMDIQCCLSKKNPHRSEKAAHYPFPQRKTPRISQTARNLGLYGQPKALDSAKCLNVETTNGLIKEPRRQSHDLGLHCE